jgi:hypothetical protein
LSAKFRHGESIKQRNIKNDVKINYVIIIKINKFKKFKPIIWRAMGKNDSQKNKYLIIVLLLFKNL